MLSVACHESPPPAPPAEPAQATYPFRRLAVTFDNDESRGRVQRRRRAAIPTLSVPVYSRIVFRAGAVSIR